MEHAKPLFNDEQQREASLNKAQRCAPCMRHGVESGYKGRVNPSRRAVTAVATVTAVASACALSTVSAHAGERIYRTHMPDGRATYSHQPTSGATLVMTLPPVRVRAQLIEDARTGRQRAQPRTTRPVPAAPDDAALLWLVDQAARRHALDMDLLLALIRQESGFDPQAVSRAGARGLMQLMPATARRYGVQRIHDPGENIAGGSAYLADLLARFGRVDLALAAYNAGEGAVEKHGRRIPPYAETTNYVSAVMADWRQRKQLIAGAR